MTQHRIKDKTVLIAGGAKNLGGAMARDLAEPGASAIAIHYNSPATKAAAESTAKAVTAAGAKAFLFQSNLTTAANVSKLFSDAKQAMGRIDIAINTVGKVIKKPLIEVDEAEYDAMSAINTKVAFFF